MSGFFGNSSGANTKPAFTGLQVQTSTSTLPVPIVMGRAKIAPNIIWNDNFQSHRGKSGGKGMGGGGKGGSSTTYTTDIILGLCEGPITKIGDIWEGNSKTTLADKGLSLWTGAGDQAVWGYLSTVYAPHALAYPWTAYLAAANFDLGSSPSGTSQNYEVYGLLSGTGINGQGDADLVMAAMALLTDPVYGAGFPAAAIDTPSWLSTATATTSGDATWQTYCRALGLDGSIALTDQESAATTLGRLFQITNTAAFWSGTALKAIPYGDEPVTGNGYTFTPSVTPVRDLTDDDFCPEDGSDPVVLTRADIAKADNRVVLEWTNASNAYTTEPLTADDQTAIDDWGLRIASTVTAHEYTTQAPAQAACDVLKSRMVGVRNQVSFRLSWEHSDLEPMDLVTLTDAALGLDRFPVRILEISEDEDQILSITAEEFLGGVATPGVAATQVAACTPINTNIPAAPVNPPLIFEPPPALTDGVAQVWVGLSGGRAGVADPYWGGATVYISVDAEAAEYDVLGQITAPARQGVLTAALAAGGDTLAIDVTASGGSLDAGDYTAAAAMGGTLCYVDGEVLSFSAVALTASGHYTLTGLTRGQYGSTSAAHASGAAFCSLNGAIGKFDLPAAAVGQTIHLKFVSRNIWGRGAQDIATVTAYAYTPTGAAYTIGAPT